MTGRPSSPGARSLLRPARQGTYEKVFAAAYTCLATNAMLAVACAPLLAALALVRDPLASWPFFAVLSLVCAPALAGAFRCFAALGSGSASVVRTFWAGYRSGARPALAVWAAGAAVVSVLVVDGAVVARTAWGPALVPFFATAVVLVVATVVALVTLVAGGAAPVRLRALVRPCVYLVVRRWYLAAANTVVLALAVGVVLARPVPGLLLACAPLLYAVWATTRFVLAPLTSRDATT
ncbi:ferredoxin-NADPH reductase [Nonomuraea rhodomycinica]|uniref:Ferredoxin-NADPH reductase n=1 Tax=Nonomuraea rhodomycinica TaxID=1712872 RepID=A0A7Y6MAK5_9ACTN|nr:ferredoxin-NADPH reductase [Nonomuraea rhodomycinica]NUW41313.1 ferredoxin-NADPH reductase [Nonomuraea rhodomycinica]